MASKDMVRLLLQQQNERKAFGLSPNNHPTSADITPPGSLGFVPTSGDWERFAYAKNALDMNQGDTVRTAVAILAGIVEEIEEEEE